MCEGSGDVAIRTGNIFAEQERHHIRIRVTRHGKEISFGIIDDPFNL